jgi:uncharacterized protein YggU (UPF0235/DUF167 family)
VRPPIPFATELQDGGLRLTVRLTPKGGRDVIEGIEVLSDGRAVLKARVQAAPAKGAANAALEALLARSLDVPRSAVTVTAGRTGRIKSVRVAGDAADLLVALSAYAAPKPRNAAAAP